MEESLYIDHVSVLVFWKDIIWEVFNLGHAKTLYPSPAEVVEMLEKHDSLNQPECMQLAMLMMK